MTEPQVQASAKNRAWRTFLQNAATDVLAALVLLIFPVISSASGWQDIDWKVMGFMVAKTIVASFLAYLMRVMQLGTVTNETGHADIRRLAVFATILTVLGVGFLASVGSTATAAPVAPAPSAQMKYWCDNCLVNSHETDDGYDGPFQVRCKDNATGATSEPWIYEYGTPGLQWETASYCWPWDPVTVVAVRISAGYKVRCTAGGAWFDYYNKGDGSWRNLGSNEYNSHNWYQCVTQVA